MSRAIFWHNKHVGDVEGVTYTSVRTPSKHYYKMGKGYPIQDAILRKLGTDGVANIIIEEHGVTGTRRYHSTLTQWFGFDVFDAGHGTQRCVPLSLCIREEVL